MLQLADPPRRVFLTGGTGYLGTCLIPKLVERGHKVDALVRKDSEHKLPPGCAAVIGDALDSSSFADHVPPADTLVHLVGVSHPSAWNANQFRGVDLTSVHASVSAAQKAQIGHFVYVSVAHPAPLMKAYIQVRMECEALIGTSGLNATILRPWYVIGPGHRWPMGLLPLYWLLEHLPMTRDSSIRLGLVTLRQMSITLLWAIEHPAQGIRFMEVSEIRAMAGQGSGFYI
jgi:uncharacterized protein YbjT (DUF2867 family)